MENNPEENLQQLKEIQIMYLKNNFQCNKITVKLIILHFNDDEIIINPNDEIYLIFKKMEKYINKYSLIFPAIQLQIFQKIINIFNILLKKLEQFLNINEFLEKKL